jgi:hypothetical protein
MRLTGETYYKIQAGATCCALGDFNNDTFVDVFAGYSGASPQFFFNRGFRSMAMCEKWVGRSIETEGVEEEGNSAALWADLDGNGSLDLVTAVRGGSVFVSRTDLGDYDPPFCIRVKLPRTAKFAGKVAVRFVLDGRCLGTRTTDRWSPPATLGTSEVGEYVVECRTPDGKEFSATVELEDKAVSVRID